MAHAHRRRRHGAHLHVLGERGSPRSAPSAESGCKAVGRGVAIRILPKCKGLCLRLLLVIPVPATGGACTPCLVRWLGAELV